MDGFDFSKGPRHVVDDYVESEIVSTTTSGTFQEKVELDIGTVKAGDFFLQWSCETANDSSDKPVQVRVQQNNTTDLAESSQAPKFDNTFFSVSGIKQLSLTAGAHTFQVQFSIDSGEGGTAQIRRARIKVRSLT